MSPVATSSAWARAWSGLFGWVLGPVLRRLLERIPFGFAVAAGPRIWLNASAYRIFEVPPDSCRTISDWFEAATHGDRSLAEARYAGYLAHRKDGWRGPVWVELPTTSGGHRTVHIIAGRFGPFELWLLEDVTEQANAADRYRVLFERSSSPHFIFTDRDGIIDCNQAFVDFLGYEHRNALIGQPPRLLSPERQPDGRMSDEKGLEMEQRAREQGFHRFDWVHATKSGELVPVEVSLNPLNLKSGPGMLVVWVDLRERQARLDALESAREEAETELAARNAFLAAMSHELRTPMNGVLGLTESLLLAPDIAAHHLQTLKTIRSSGQGLRQLLDDLLDFSKYEAGEIQLEAVPFELNRFLHETSELYRKRLQPGVELVLHPTESAPCFVEGDPHRAAQIVGNLVSNAVKFTSRGKVELSVRVVEDEVIFRVKDTGIGMTEAQMRSVFEPFRQVERSATRRFGGTGIGLAIVDRLSSAMGGRVEVSSTLNVGTLFEVFLPMRCVDPLRELSESFELQSHSADLERIEGLEVLVVEDNRVNQLVLERILARVPGVNARFVGDGSEVAAAVEAGVPDLVLMDVHMPVMDGLEATRRLRASGFERPIVAVTASCLDSEIEACKSSGMNRVLAKPVDVELLDEVLLDAWRRRVSPSEPDASL